MAGELNNIFNACSGFTVLVLVSVFALAAIALGIKIFSGDRSKPT